MTKSAYVSHGFLLALIDDFMIERTLVLIKPEAVCRGISGRIIQTFEDAGLKIVAIKAVKPAKEIVEKHYTLDKEWYEGVWEKTKKSYDKQGLELKETPLELGTKIRGWLIDGIKEKPVIAMVLEGNDAISAVRKFAGATAPSLADPSTIRGMFSTDSYSIADSEHRIVRSIIHASDGIQTAEREIAAWFEKDEIIAYRRAEENITY